MKEMKNPGTKALLIELGKLKKKALIWRDMTVRLGKKGKKSEVNVGKLGLVTKKGETVVVPGVVLGDGMIEHAVTVAALRFSKIAKEKIEKVGGKAMSITELASKNPDGKNIRIMG